MNLNNIIISVNGTKRKILGMESMDQLIIEAEEEDKLGDIVKIFGPKDKGYIYDIIEFAKKGKIKSYKMILTLHP